MPGDYKVWIILLILIIIIALIIYVIVESSGYKIVSYDLFSDKLLDKSLKIAFLADLHNKDFGNYNETLIESIDKFKPDIVCFSGDMVTSGWDLKYDFSGTLKFIEKLSQKYPIYYSLGNHEDMLDNDRDRFPSEYDELVRALNDMGVHYLDNISENIDDFPVKIYGLRLSHLYFDTYYKDEIEEGVVKEALGDVDSDVYSVLLAHDPRHFKKYASWGADLVLSGHVHGGIVSLPFFGGIIAPGMKFFPKFDAGLFKELNSTMILTRGIGSHLIPLRINNKAEIVFINISKEK